MTRYVYRRLRHVVVYRVLHADDTPHRIALGVAVGLFVAMSPLFGLHMILALILAIILRANRAIAIAAAWVCNPATFLPILSLNWFVGQTVIPQEALQDPGQIQRRISQATGGAEGLFSAEFWVGLFNLIVGLGAEIWVGSIVVGLVVAPAGYLVIHRAVLWHRHHRLARRARRARPVVTALHKSLYVDQRLSADCVAVESTEHPDSPAPSTPVEAAAAS
ncbi:MAG: DUF2062 domain-containing protein [Phycisphaerales bacterium]|nr:MAG: DUF2062 domain-containing protein [Phycisphaerales bacterium]